MKVPKWQRPLTQVEDRLVWQTASAAEAVLGSRDPALLCSLVAHLLAGMLFDHAERVRDLDAMHDVVSDMLTNIMDRVDELADTVLASAASAGTA